MNLILFAIFVILQFLDFWTTYNVIQSGKGHEGNAIMAWLIDKLGIIGAFSLAKSIVILFFAYLATRHFYINLFNLDVVSVIFIVFNLIYCFVVFSNYLIFKKG
jgi:hypothetical protein